MSKGLTMISLGLGFLLAAYLQPWFAPDMRPSVYDPAITFLAIGAIYYLFEVIRILRRMRKDR